MPEYHGIWRNITEYGGISRNMAEYHGISRHFPGIYLDVTIFFDGSHAGSGGATGRTGEDTSPPVLFKVNFLICPNPVRKMGGGYVCDISPVI
jgi:hypothetical protein